MTEKTCIGCQKIKAIEEFPIASYARKGPRKAYRRRYCATCHADQSLKRYVQTRSRLKREYGITLDEYNQMLKAQNYKCLLCGLAHKEGTDAAGRSARLAVDHDHKTKKVRGLLCRMCNGMLGLARDNTRIMMNGVAYLCQHTPGGAVYYF